MANKSKTELDAKELANIDRVQSNLGAGLGDGADPCPNCGYPPVGMIRTPSHINRGVEMPTLYEVGCIRCPPYLVAAKDGIEGALDGKAANVKRRSYSALAYSREQAVENWNGGKFVEDTKIDLNVPSSQRARLG